jgi:CYTH domain-containing protein
MSTSVEIERKFIIEMPDISALRTAPDHTESRITQIYLESETGVTHRVRLREYADVTVATETKKIRIDSMSAVEDEREITLAEFEEKSREIARGTRPVCKTRHTLRHGAYVIEIDVYPEWQSTAILEVELPTRETRVELPPYIRVIREVTGDRKYSNASLSHAFPAE